MLNFSNKNKKQKKAQAEEKPIEENIKNPHLVSVWDKKSYIDKKFANRPIEFYVRNYRININIALFFSVSAFLVVFLSGFIIEQKKSEHDYYVTSTDGRVVEHSLTQEDIEKMREAFRKISQRNN